MTLAVIASTALFAQTNGGIPVALSVIITLLIGCACGVFNGFFVVGLGIDPFIVTLGSASVFVGHFRDDLG